MSESSTEDRDVMQEPDPPDNYGGPSSDTRAEECMEDVMEELDKLDAAIQRHNAHQQRLNKYYDEAPDGSQQKQDALDQMARVGEKLREAWARVDQILEEHPEI